MSIQVPKKLWTPPKNMRDLPGDLVTQEAADPNRVHTQDPEHIKRGIMKQEAAKLVAQATPYDMAKAAFMALIGQRLRKGPFKLDQNIIDYLRGGILLKGLAVKGDDQPVRHLWFDGDDFRVRSILPGNPPAPSDRPEHLRKYRLEMDPLAWPDQVCDIVRVAGIDIDRLLGDRRDRKRFEEAVRAASGTS